MIQAEAKTGPQLKTSQLVTIQSYDGLCKSSISIVTAVAVYLQLFIFMTNCRDAIVPSAYLSPSVPPSPHGPYTCFPPHLAPHPSPHLLKVPRAWAREGG